VIVNHLLFEIINLIYETIRITGQNFIFERVGEVNGPFIDQP